jgi:tetratricopeptide (TPR) repeat protein
VSEEYLRAPYSTLERNAASWQAAKDRPGFVLLVLVKPCKVPLLIAHLKRCDLHGISEVVAQERLKAFLEPPRRPPRGVFPGDIKTSSGRASTAPSSFFPGKTALSNIPLRVPLHFLGRDDALAAVEAALKLRQGRVAITALHGLRGVGKSTLAAAFAERHRGDYRATWWIRAETELTMRADLVRLGLQLGWVGTDDKEEPAVAAVSERLRDQGEGILLIFDNATDANAITPYLPHTGATKVLVTSYSHAWRSIAEPVQIRVWPKDNGAEYLIARTGRTDERNAAETLSESLGGLPLAHEQVAAYCERLEISLAEFSRRFGSAPLRFLDRDASAAYGRTVEKIFSLAIEEAAKLNSGAEPLIVHAGLLAPEPIPLFLFAEGREQFGEPLKSALAGDGLDEAVAALRKFALIEREAIKDERDRAITTDSIRLHRLVRDVAVGRPREEQRQSAQRALVAALATAYPDDGYSNPASWPRCALLTSHVLAICETETADTNSQCATLLNRAGEYFYGRAAYSLARPLCERALAIREKVLGPEHPDTAESLNDVAFLLKDRGELAQAKPLHERALAIREKVLGPEHPDTALSLNNLALLLQDQGELAQAKPLLERALAIHEKVLGPEHPETAASLNNLANLLQDQGELAQAKPLLERALAIREKVLGPEHPDTAQSLNNLALLLKDQGELAQAKPLLERALATWEKVLGAEHPNTNRARRNLACVHLAAGDSAEALTLGEAALAAHEKVVGASDMWTKDSAGVTADALDALGRTEEATTLRIRYGIDGGA